MGLERIASVLQDRRNNYDTDLFLPIVNAMAARAGRAYGSDPGSDTSLRVIADHVRALCFLVADGVVPANDNRGYVLRRVLRRAIRHGLKLDVREPFLHEVVPAVVETLGEVYPEIVAAQPAILEVARREEERFRETVTAALQLLDQSFAGLKGSPPVLAGSELFRLYDTFGLPLDLAQDVAEERGVALDVAGFEEHLAQQRQRAQASWKGVVREETKGAWQDLAGKFRTLFEGYRATRIDGTKIVAVVGEGGLPAGELREGDSGEVLLEATPFYGEAGGQVGDTGWIVAPEGRARVIDTHRPAHGLVASRVQVEAGRLAVGDYVAAEVDEARRASVQRNHSATHLVHAALREVVGTHVKQAGSLVASDRLRFDFTHFSPLSDRALSDIETLVNGRVLGNAPVETAELPLDDALRSGAMALFGEKYGDRVRVVTMGDFSKELCGGTHVARTGEIGLVKITQERGVAAGTRRVEALSGEGSLEAFRQSADILRAAERSLSVGPDELIATIERQREQMRDLQREIDRVKLDAVCASLVLKAESPQVVSGIKVLAERADGVASGDMRTLADNLRRKLGSGVVILGRADEGKASLLVAVTDDLKGRFPAGEIVRDLAKVVGGGGGGRADMAEAGGKDPSRLDEALRMGTRIVAQRVGASAS